MTPTRRCPPEPDRAAVMLASFGESGLASSDGPRPSSRIVRPNASARPPLRNSRRPRRHAHPALPPLPTLFHRHLTTTERADKARRKRKAKTDIVSRCATAILALTQARKASMDRFISWYRAQISRIETDEVPIPVQRVYEDLELDLPRQPGPDSASLTDLTWQRKPVRLDLTIWRPVAFVSVLHERRVETAPLHSRQREIALGTRRVWRSIQRAGKRAG